MTNTKIRIDKKTTDPRAIEFKKKLMKFALSEDGELQVNDENDSYVKFGTSDVDLLGALNNQLLNLTNTGDGIPTRSMIDSANAGMAFVIEMKPQDPTEMFLASQMFAIQKMAMDTARRADSNELTHNVRDQYINQSIKLMRTFTSQVEALAKYRTKGKQKITVQHVNVENGGQAIVGDVVK